MPAVQQRRYKLAKRFHEQMELARAQQAGTQYAPVKFRTVKDADTGARKQIETHKRVKAWWFTADNGKLALCVRYGTKILELAKGKYAIEVALSIFCRFVDHLELRRAKHQMRPISLAATQTGVICMLWIIKNRI